MKVDKPFKMYANGCYREADRYWDDLWAIGMGKMGGFPDPRIRMRTSEPADIPARKYRAVQLRVSHMPVSRSGNQWHSLRRRLRLLCQGLSCRPCGWRRCCYRGTRSRWRFRRRWGAVQGLFLMSCGPCGPSESRVPTASRFGSRVLRHEHNILYWEEHCILWVVMETATNSQNIEMMFERILGKRENIERQALWTGISCRINDQRGCYWRSNGCGKGDRRGGFYRVYDRKSIYWKPEKMTILSDIVRV